MGGTAFTHAFSMYMRMRGPSEYHVPPEDLAGRSHPVTWLRIRLLADRALRMGYEADAQSLDETWGRIAASMGIFEDYYGFYDKSSFSEPIQKTIDDMLMEASPRYFREQEVEAVETDPIPDSPVYLLNLAWKKFQEDADGYRTWEERTINDFLELDILR